MLRWLLADQANFMDVLEVEDSENEGWLSPAFKDAIIGIVCEGSEVLSAITDMQRPWKRVNNAAELEAKRQHVMEETIDVFFFLLEAWVLAGWHEADVHAGYRAKLVKNLQRILNNIGPIGLSDREWTDNEIHQFVEADRLLVELLHRDAVNDG